MTTSKIATRFDLTTRQGIQAFMEVWAEAEILSYGHAWENAEAEQIDATREVIARAKEALFYSDGAEYALLKLWEAKHPALGPGVRDFASLEMLEETGVFEPRW